MFHQGRIAQRVLFVLFSFVFCVSMAGTVCALPASSAGAARLPQEPAAPGRSDSTASPDDIDAKLKAREKKKEERKPDLEIRAVRTSPSDTITFFKPNHWTLFQLALLANNSDETVELRSGYEPLLESMGTPHAVLYRRLVQLIKDQERFVRLPMFLPEGRKGKSVELALYRVGGVLPIQPPGIERQPCTVLESDQFLLVALSPDPDNYRFLSGMQFVVPGVEALDEEPGDKRRYYHLVSQFQPNRPIVAESAIAWTSIAYVLWDDLDPGLLTLRQQEALLDWLHMGGQLIVSGGASATRLEQSFLAPYLPADVAGSAQLSDFGALESTYLSARTFEKSPQTKAMLVQPAKPVYLAKLSPRPGAEPVARQDVVGDTPLLVERRVGRGRIQMAAFSLYQPEFVLNWKEAYDTFLRQRVFRLEETAVNSSFQLGTQVTRSYVRLPARKLSRLSITARDLGASTRTAVRQSLAARDELPGSAPSPSTPEKTDAVADWSDATPLPGAARQTLLAATGIKIPPPDFVLAAALSYILVLVPLNWVICRFALHRPELAWLIAPFVIIGFSIGIVKFARVNVGYDSASHEIDVVELFAGYPRGHVSRFTSVYSGSRGRFQFRYDDAHAVALPMSIGDVQRGHNIERINLEWDFAEGAPVAFGRYEVHPRSIGMVRAEEFRSFAGAIQRQVGAANPMYENQTGWDLWDCHLVTAQAKTRIGDWKNGAVISLAPGDAGNPEQPDLSDGRLAITDGLMAGHSRWVAHGELNPLALLALLEDQSLDGGTRLVAWAPRAVSGQQIDPATDRAMGFSVFVIHLGSP